MTSMRMCEVGDEPGYQALPMASSTAPSPRSVESPSPVPPGSPRARPAGTLVGEAMSVVKALSDRARSPSQDSGDGSHSPIHQFIRPLLRRHGSSSGSRPTSPSKNYYEKDSILRCNSDEPLFGCRDRFLTVEEQEFKAQARWDMESQHLQTILHAALEPVATATSTLDNSMGHVSGLNRTSSGSTQQPSTLRGVKASASTGNLRSRVAKADQRVGKKKKPSPPPMPSFETIRAHTQSQHLFGHRSDRQSQRISDPGQLIGGQMPSGWLSAKPVDVDVKDRFRVSTDELSQGEMRAMRQDALLRGLRLTHDQRDILLLGLQHVFAAYKDIYGRDLKRLEADRARCVMRDDVENLFESAAAIAAFCKRLINQNMQQKPRLARFVRWALEPDISLDETFWLSDASVGALTSHTLYQLLLPCHLSHEQETFLRHESSLADSLMSPP